MSVERIAYIRRRSSDCHPYEPQNFDHAAVGLTIPSDCNAFAGSTSNMFSPRYPKRRTTLSGASFVILSTLFIPLAAAQATGSCISLANSRTCSAFNGSSISTSSALVGNFPFLQYVANTQQFDNQFEQYIKQDYAKHKFQDLFGCSNLTLSNTTELYARYTRSVLCSRMIQDSRKLCSLSTQASTPICADACAQFAISEQIIISNEETCGSSSTNTLDLIRSDFTICALPSDSLSGKCIQGEDNESYNCGYNENLPGLCLYCASSSPNSTDTCCYNANAQKRCADVDLPTATALPPIFTTSSSPSASSSSGSGSLDGGSGLSGGAIAGITIGALGGVALVAFLVLFCRRRRRYLAPAPTFTQPTRTHRSPSMTFNPVAANVHAQGYEVLAGGRIARMSALEPINGAPEGDPSSPAIVAGGGRRVIGNNSSSSDFGLEDSPESHNRQKYSPQGRPLRPPPPRDRNTSLSSSSILMSDNPTSPITDSDRGPSSPQFASPQSEQLPYFKDYYSSDDMHPGDKVAVLWAYAPRAPDEFELDRGDMIKIVGIWDDGWATGVRLNERAEDFINRRHMRDSGISASQMSQRRASSPPPRGEVKAFPLVCVCLPEHWHKTIESDTQGAEFASQTMSDPAEGSSIKEGRLPDDSNTERSFTPERRLTLKGSSRFREDLNVPRTGSSPLP
ncbi:hypothetical protein L873DRAFT_1796739 [Choiromyces venosus 120613-1]|uniref:SH3 domain-containing protein n=1 Tax=Choiromyces venosus 120613-1 TaxID=1336337 RepID=A0A3N4K970_9PEZI|nr:hypothetical protein L873DRAFT_1796739 [Choiromyces venosus 120613-1]